MSFSLVFMYILMLYAAMINCEQDAWVCILMLCEDFRIHIYIYVYTYTYIPYIHAYVPYIRTYIHTYIYLHTFKVIACRYTFICTYTHTYLHIYIQICMHTTGTYGLCECCQRCEGTERSVCGICIVRLQVCVCVYIYIYIYILLYLHAPQKDVCCELPAC